MTDDQLMEELHLEYLEAVERGEGYTALLVMQSAYPQYAGELAGFAGTHAIMHTAPKGPEPTPERMAHIHQLGIDAFKKVFGHYPPSDDHAAQS